MSGSVAVCDLCDYSVPLSDPTAVAEIAEHLRRKHPRHVDDDAPGSGGAVTEWVIGARRILQRFTLHRQSIDASVAVASRLRTALALLEDVQEALEQGEALRGPDRGLLHAEDIRGRWRRTLDGI